MKTKLCLFFCCFNPCQAQSPLPDAPSTTKAWALNIGTNAKYSITKAKWDSVPKIVLDYRFTSRLRTGLELSRSLVSGDSSVSIGLNYKLAEWGRKR